MNLRKISSEKIILVLGVFTFLFLISLYLNDTIFHSSFVLIGVIQEILTIPCILGQPILLFLTIRGLFKKKFKQKIYGQVATIVLVLGISFTITIFLIS